VSVVKSSAEAAAKAKAVAEAKAAYEEARLARIARVTGTPGSICGSAAAFDAKSAAEAKAAYEEARLARIARVTGTPGSMCGSAAAFDAKSAAEAKAAFDAESAAEAKAAAEYNALINNDDCVWDYGGKIVLVIDFNNICPTGLFRTMKNALKYYAKWYNVVAVYVVASYVNETDDQFLSSLFGVSYSCITFPREQNGTEGELVDVSIAHLIQSMLEINNLNKLVIFSGDGNKELGDRSICTAIMYVVAQRPPKFVVVCAPLLSMHTRYKKHDGIEIKDLNDFSKRSSQSDGSACASPFGGSDRSVSPSGGSERSDRSASPFGWSEQSERSTCASPSGGSAIPQQARCSYWERGFCKFGDKCYNAAAHN
jgi:hypothetical protein